MSTTVTTTDNPDTPGGPITLITVGAKGIGAATVGPPLAAGQRIAPSGQVY